VCWAGSYAIKGHEHNENPAHEDLEQGVCRGDWLS